MEDAAQQISGSLQQFRHQIGYAKVHGPPVDVLELVEAKVPPTTIDCSKADAGIQC